MISRLVVCCVVLMVSALAVRAQDALTANRILPHEIDSLVDFSPDLSHLIIVSLENDVMIYDLISRSDPIRRSLNSDELVHTVAWNVDDQSVLIRTSLHLYQVNVTTGEATSLLETPLEHEIVSAQFRDGYIVAHVAVGKDENLERIFETHIWDAETLTQSSDRPTEDPCYREIVISNTLGDYVQGIDRQPDPCDVSNVSDTTLEWEFWGQDPVIVYDAKGTQRFVLRHCSSGKPDDEACDETAALISAVRSPDGTLIATLPVYVEDRIKIWDAETGTLVRTLNPIPAPTEPGAVFGGLQWTRPDRLTVWGYENVFLINPLTGQQIFSWPYLYTLLSGVRWIDNEQFVFAWGGRYASATVNGVVWDAASGKQVGVLPRTDENSEGIRAVVEDTERGVLYLLYDNSIDVYDLDSFISGLKPEIQN